MILQTELLKFFKIRRRKRRCWQSNCLRLTAYGGKPNKYSRTLMQSCFVLMTTKQINGLSCVFCVPPHTENTRRSIETCLQWKYWKFPAQSNAVADKFYVKWKVCISYLQWTTWNISTGLWNQRILTHEIKSTSKTLEEICEASSKTMFN